MFEHHIIVFYSEEDGGYIAEVPDLPGCSAWGSTPEQAVAEVMTAKQAWIDSAGAEGRPIPEPRPRPVTAL